MVKGIDFQNRNEMEKKKKENDVDADRLMPS
jgi:hypothetical protein